MTSQHRHAALLALLVVVGCSSRAATTSAGATSSATSSGAGGHATVGSASASTTGGFSTGAGLTGCANPQAALAWVVSDVQDTYYNLVYTFDPSSKVFTPVMTLNCSSPGKLDSMAISRDRVGWYAYNEAASDEIYSSDLANRGDCKPFMSIPSSFGVKTMAFVADTPGGSTETLYLSGKNGALAKIDMANKQLVMVGSWSGDPSLATLPAMLAGRSDGRLSALFLTSPDVHAVDTDTTGHIATNDAMTGMPPTHVVAFTRWHSKEYVFTTEIPGLCGYPPEPCSDSAVAEYDPTTKTLNAAFIPSAGFAIVGASATTCPAM